MDFITSWKFPALQLPLFCSGNQFAYSLFEDQQSQLATSIPDSEAIVFSQIVVVREGAKTFGSYRIPDNLGFDTSSFLEGFKIDFDAPEHQLFTITEIYHNYSNLVKPDDTNIQKAVSLAQYFSERSNSPELEQFIQVEQKLVNKLMGDFDPKRSEYLPVAVGEEGQLTRVLYFLYDPSQLSEDALGNLEKFKKALGMNI